MYCVKLKNVLSVYLTQPRDIYTGTFLPPKNKNFQKVGCWKHIHSMTLKFQKNSILNSLDLFHAKIHRCFGSGFSTQLISTSLSIINRFPVHGVAFAGQWPKSYVKQRNFHLNWPRSRGFWTWEKQPFEWHTVVYVKAQKFSHKICAFCVVCEKCAACALSEPYPAGVVMHKILAPKHTTIFREIFFCRYFLTIG